MKVRARPGGRLAPVVSFLDRSMGYALELLRRERSVRGFFAAALQSAIGTGAAYPALLLVAYDQLRSPWAATLVLIADMAPAVLMGPLAGAVVDRWPRRSCAVVADLVRAAAFAGIVISGDLWLTVALATIAGAGTALFRPAVLAGLPSLVSAERRPAANALFASITSLDLLVGSALGAAALVVVSPTALLAANAVTFAISAALLARSPFGQRAAAERDATASIWAETRDGIEVTLRLPVVRAVVASSSGLLLCAGLFNVAELVYATRELGAGDAGFSALVACFGAGIATGSLFGANAHEIAAAKRGFLLGVAVVAGGFIAAAVAPAFAIAAAAFLLAGTGNGLVMVHERLLIQNATPPEMLGRVFGAMDAAGSLLFASGFAIAGALVATAGARVTIGVAGASALIAWAGASWALRRPSEDPARPIEAAV